MLAETEIVRYRQEIATLESTAVAKRGAADKLVEDVRSSGVDPLHDGDAFMRIDEAYKESDGPRDEAMVLRTRLDRLLGTNEGGGAGAGNPATGRTTRGRESIGSRFRSSDSYQRVAQSGALKMKDSRVNSDPVEVASREEFMDLLRQRTTLDLATGGALVPEDIRAYPPVEIPTRPVALLDLVTMTTTESDIVEWVLQTKRGDAAAETPYGTGAPEADYEFARQTSQVKRIPQFVPASKGILADQAQAESLIDQQLINGVRLRLEAQILAGNGQGDNLLGILNTVYTLPDLSTLAIGSVARANAVTGPPAVAAEYNLDAIHHAITKVRLGLFQDPDAIGLHPANLESIMLQKDSYGRYIFEPSAEQKTIWGFPAVSTPVFTEDTGLVGNFRIGAKLYMREALSIALSDQHSDFFIKGLVAILAEVRAAFVCEQPLAFSEVTNLAH
jgi:HK97 family phage major capsid protein